MSFRRPYRGENGCTPAFARDFIVTRVGGFRKDIEICLTDTANANGRGVTHAYFPALGACCGLLEYMTALHRGYLDGVGWQQVTAWTRRYLDRNDYSDDTVRVLFQAFRHSVAHRGIATGIWVDRRTATRPERRITWKLSEVLERPACSLREDAGTLRKDPPWDTPHTHRMHISLAALAADLSEGALRFVDDIERDAGLLQNFCRAMRALYPK